MAQLKGNDLTEWIKALLPVDPESFKTMEKGAKIIHLSSTSLEPYLFDFYDLEMDMVGALLDGDIAPTSFSGDCWFYYPEPAVEAEPIKARQPGKVRELGDGKWKTIGVKGVK